jgi:hypothetical protein
MFIFSGSLQLGIMFSLSVTGILYIGSICIIAKCTDVGIPEYNKYDKQNG